jgi:dTDP-4-amino-4,6-dideoxygalactose transaminase
MYRTALSDIPAIQLPQATPSTNPMWHLYPIRVPIEKRESIYKCLRSNGFGVQVNYLPAHWQPVFRKIGESDRNLMNSEKFYKSEISLPMWVSETNWTSNYFAELVDCIESVI